jgi:hypothetical protein
VTPALAGVLYAVDGVALKQAADAWVSAPAAEQTARPSDCLDEGVHSSPRDRCDVCHEWALLSDSDLVLCPCGAELWVHEACMEAGGPCPKCRRVWTQDEQPSARPNEPSG